MNTQLALAIIVFAGMFTMWVVAPSLLKKRHSRKAE